MHDSTRVYNVRSTAPTNRHCVDYDFEGFEEFQYLKGAMKEGGES